MTRLNDIEPFYPALVLIAGCSAFGVAYGVFISPGDYALQTNILAGGLTGALMALFLLAVFAATDWARNQGGTGL